jgi:hypothetical protein
MRVPNALMLLTAALLAVFPLPARAQSVQEVLTTIRNGGGWVSVVIDDGFGTASTVMLPTMGMALSGCLNVWEGHTGEWLIRARDTIARDSLAVRSTPGRGVRFAHEFGLRSKLEFDFEWSEPRDTTLYLWVGLDREDDGPTESCTPK